MWRRTPWGHRLVAETSVRFKECLWDIITKTARGVLGAGVPTKPTPMGGKGCSGKGMAPLFVTANPAPIPVAYPTSPIRVKAVGGQPVFLP